MHLIKGILNSSSWNENILNFILINVRSDLKLKSNMNSIRNPIFNHYHFTHYLILDQIFMLCCAINSQCFAFFSACSLDNSKGLWRNFKWPYMQKGQCRVVGSSRVESFLFFKQTGTRLSFSLTRTVHCAWLDRNYTLKKIGIWGTALIPRNLVNFPDSQIFKEFSWFIGIRWIHQIPRLLGNYPDSPNVCVFGKFPKIARQLRNFL